MAALDDDIARARELLDGVEDAGLGRLTHRKMFGGAALYAGGRIFALIVDGEIMLKAAPASPLVAALEAAGSARWRYEGKATGAKPTAMPYWRLPDSALDDPVEAVDWARRSLASTAETG